MTRDEFKSLLIETLEAWVRQDVDTGASATASITEDHVVAYMDEPADLKRLAERVLTLVETAEPAIKVSWTA